MPWKFSPNGTAREVLRGEGLAGPEVAVGVVHLDRAGAHGVEAFERRNQFARAEDLDLQPPARHGLDAFGQVGGAARAVHVERRALAVGAGHLPAEALLRVRDGGRRQRARKACLQCGTT